MDFSHQYLDSAMLLDAFPTFEIKVEDLGSSDSYHERKIIDRILLMPKNEIRLLMKAAVQISIIGSGNRNFGFIRDDDQVIQIKDLFKRLNIAHENVQNSKLKEDDLTARRLVRLFRCQIQIFIKQTGRPSYLWFKYSKRDPTMISYCFPGAEHLITEPNQIEYLYETYRKLDEQHGTQFQLRLQRVFIARGLQMTKT